MMKYLCLICALTVLPVLSNAQTVRDTVVIYIDNRVEISIALTDYSELKSSDKIASTLEEFSNLLTQFSAKLSAETPEMVRYIVGSELTVEPGNPQQIYLMKEGRLSDTGFRDRANIIGKDFQIIITTTDLSAISEMPLTSCLENTVEVMPERSRWSKSLYFDCINNIVSLREDKNNEWDMLELSIGAGTGLVKNTWVPDLTLGINFIFNKKGVIRGPYLTSNTLFDFTTENKLNLNTFLNLGYRWTMDKKKDKYNTMGVELGYLVSRQGEIFGENTFKLGLNWSPAKHITVSPHLYITDNFSQAFPGVRIGFGF